MRLTWAQRIYHLVLTIYPKEFRSDFGAEMELLFLDLAHDPEIHPLDLAWRAAKDFRGGVAMLLDQRPNIALVRWSAIFGCAELALWIAGRTLHPGLYVHVPLVPTPFLLFVLVGIAGGRITKTFTGGLAAGFLTGLISAISVPGDYLLFHSSPFYDLRSFVLAMIMVALFCMVPAGAGSFVANLPDLFDRARRGASAFGSAWRRSSA